MSRFQFVNMGERAPAGAISCDGLVKGADLDLSHWVGNRTPPELKADTSTEIALNFVRSPLATRFERATIVNNHYDTDGVLSVWTLLDPDAAHARRDLITSAAEAGDFQEWPKDRRGIHIDAALLKIGEEARDETDAYQRALAMLPKLLDEIEMKPDLWNYVDLELNRAIKLVRNGVVEATRHGRVGIIRHGAGIAELPGPVIAKLLGPSSWRYLLAFAGANETWNYRYELPRYAWAEVVHRTPLEKPPAAALAQKLGAQWIASKERPGSTEVVETQAPVPEAPEEMLLRIAQVETLPLLNA